MPGRRCFRCRGQGVRADRLEGDGWRLAGAAAAIILLQYRYTRWWTTRRTSWRLLSGLWRLAGDRIEDECVAWKDVSWCQWNVLKHVFGIGFGLIFREVCEDGQSPSFVNFVRIHGSRDEVAFDLLELFLGFLGEHSYSLRFLDVLFGLAFRVLGSERLAHRFEDIFIEYVLEGLFIDRVDVLVEGLVVVDGHGVIASWTVGFEPVVLREVIFLFVINGPLIIHRLPV